MASLAGRSTLFFICDIQGKFREFSPRHDLNDFLITRTGQAIHGFDHVIAMTNKMLKFAEVSCDFLIDRGIPR